MDKNEAILAVTALKQRQYQRGAVDVEGAQFDSILRRLATGELEPKEAVAQASSIDKGRQDYH